MLSFVPTACDRNRLIGGGSKSAVVMVLGRRRVVSEFVGPRQQLARWLAVCGLRFVSRGGKRLADPFSAPFASSKLHLASASWLALSKFSLLLQIGALKWELGSSTSKVVSRQKAPPRKTEGERA